MNMKKCRFPDCVKEEMQKESMKEKEKQSIEVILWL